MKRRKDVITVLVGIGLTKASTNFPHAVDPLRAKTDGLFMRHGQSPASAMVDRQTIQQRCEATPSCTESGQVLADRAG